MFQTENLTVKSYEFELKANQSTDVESFNCRTKLRTLGTVKIKIQKEVFCTSIFSVGFFAIYSKDQQ